MNSIYQLLGLSLQMNRRRMLSLRWASAFQLERNPLLFGGHTKKYRLYMYMYNSLHMSCVHNFNIMFYDHVITGLPYLCAWSNISASNTHHLHLFQHWSSQDVPRDSQRSLHSLCLCGRHLSLLVIFTTLQTRISDSITSVVKTDISSWQFCTCQVSYGWKKEGAYMCGIS